MSKVGFVGMGNMAQAMAEGFLRSGKLEQEDLLAYAPHQDKRIGFQPVDTLQKLVKRSDVVILACKPYQIREVLAETGAALAGKALLSVAAGWVYQDFQSILGDSVRIQCIMPNTPAMVFEGAFAVCSDNDFTRE